MQLSDSLWQQVKPKHYLFAHIFIWFSCSASAATIASAFFQSIASFIVHIQPTKLRRHRTFSSRLQHNSMSSANNNYHQHTSFEMGDQLIQWDEEARAIIDDVKNHVSHICISEALPSNSREIFLNCQTLEENKYTIRISSNGFQVVGRNYDCFDESSEAVAYETPYALLDAISPEYTKSFAENLTRALEKLV